MTETWTTCEGLGPALLQRMSEDLQNYQASGIPELYKRSNELQERIAETFTRLAPVIGKMSTRDVDVVKLLLAEDFGDHLEEHMIIGQFLGRAEEMRHGANLQIPKGSRLKVVTNTDGLFAGSITASRQERAHGSESFPPARHVETGEVFYGRPLVLSTVPELGGKIVFAGLRSSRFLVGLIDGNAKPRVSLEVQKPNRGTSFFEAFAIRRYFKLPN
jgi:hypothetical protein